LKISPRVIGSVRGHHVSRSRRQCMVPFSHNLIEFSALSAIIIIVAVPGVNYRRRPYRVRPIPTVATVPPDGSPGKVFAAGQASRAALP
jgi:hypothetical protein